MTEYLIIGTVLATIGFIMMILGLIVAHRNKRTRNVFVYLTHVQSAIATLFLIICAHTWLMKYLYAKLLVAVLLQIDEACKNNLIKSLPVI
jgi:hypothetical protein